MFSSASLDSQMTVEELKTNKISKFQSRGQDGDMKPQGGGHVAYVALGYTPGGQELFKKYSLNYCEWKNHKEGQGLLLYI